MQNTKTSNIASIFSIVVAVAMVIAALVLISLDGSSEQLKKSVVDPNIYSIKSVLDLITKDPSHFDQKEISVNAEVVDSVRGIGCHDYLILMDKEDAETYRQLFKRYESTTTTEIERIQLSEQIHALPNLLSGETLTMNNISISIGPAIYEGHFNDPLLSQSCPDGNTRFVIDGSSTTSQTTTSSKI